MCIRDRYYKEGIYSPITQNQRHLQVLKERRSENDGKILAAWKNYLFKDFFRGLVVLANPKTVVNDRYAKKEVKEQVIRADQLIETIKRMNKASKESASSLKDLKEMGERYLQMHIEKPITYIEKFKQEDVYKRQPVGRAVRQTLDKRILPGQRGKQVLGVRVLSLIHISSYVSVYISGCAALSEIACESFSTGMYSSAVSAVQRSICSKSP